MDFNKEVNLTMKKMVKDGKIQEIIEKQLEETVKNIVRDSLKDWSDFGKTLTEKIKKSVNCTDIEFPDYTAKMADYILTYVGNVVDDEIKKSMEKQVRNFFKPLEYESITVSKIIEELKNGIDSSDREDLSGECTAFINRDYGFVRLYFDKEEGKDKYECEYQIAFSQTDSGNYEVFHIRVNPEYGKEHDLTKSKYAILGSLEKMLFQLYSQKIEIIIDEDKIDTELCFEGEYY